MLSISLLRGLRLSLLPLLIVAFVAAIGAFFYVRAETLMAGQLRQLLQTTASVAAQQFDPRVIARVVGDDDRGSAAHRTLVSQLQALRAMAPGVRYAYLVRATDDPSIVTFIADADEFRSVQELDLNGNGVVDDDEGPAAPGEEYDIAGMAAFQEAFMQPSVDPYVTYDRWGALISGYAPVRDASGRTVAVLGIDMNADEFLGIAQSIFSPVAFLLVVIGGVLLGFVSFSVVQRRRLEALRQIDAERTALLNLATHQLGMPLATFRWWLEILHDRASCVLPDDREAFEQLQLGVDRMTSIVQSLQEAAQLQSGAMPYQPEAIDPVEFVRTVVADLQPALALKHQSVSVDTTGDLPFVRIDRKIIRGVLSELLENARSFSPDGSTMTVRLRRERSVVRVSVEDRGCGIPAADMPKLFQKFTRARNAATVKPVGNGLGLYICKGLLERAGGTIAVQSVEGVGTTVSFTLPIDA